jgi:hypothetical protein
VRSIIAIACLGVCVGPAPLHAQARDASAPDPAAARGQDAEDANVIERYRARYQALRDRGITFTLGSILPGSSLAAGAGLERDRLFGTFVGASFDAAWSIRGYHRYVARVGRLKGREHRTALSPADAAITEVFNDNSLLAFGTSLFVEAEHRIFPRVDFFGLGQQSEVGGRSDFRVNGSSVDVVFQWQRNAHFGVSARAGTLDLRVGPGTNHGVSNTEDRYTEAEAPGLHAAERYRVQGGAATVDFRDRAHLTSSGTFLGVALWHAGGVDAADPSAGWTRLTTDIRGFLPIAGPAHVLALHGIVSTRLDSAEVPTPFYLQPTLGGSDTLRGFGSYRLRGEALWTATAEYRWRPHRWIEVAPFLDIGAVAHSWGGLSDAGATATPGIGLRATTSSRVIGRLDVAGGRDGTRAVVTLSTPF